MAADAQRQIGRVEKADIRCHGNIVALDVSFSYADRSAQGIGRVVCRDLLRRFMAVWNAEALSETVGKQCWVTHTNSSILKLEPLFENEGEALDFAEGFVDDPQRVGG